jgi:hypothetical protein
MRCRKKLYDALSVRRKRTREAAKAPEVARERKEAKRALEESGLLDKLSRTPGGTSPAPKKAAKAGSSARASAVNGPAGRAAASPAAEEFQARVARMIPRLDELRLSQAQIEGVRAIIQELFEGG